MPPYSIERRRKHIYLAMFFTWAFVILVAAISIYWKGVSTWADFVLKHALIVFGLSLGGLMAFILVVLFSEAPLSETKTDLSFEMFGLKFTGPAGPILLWCASFLSIAFATWLLSPA